LLLRYQDCSLEISNCENLKEICGIGKPPLSYVTLIYYLVDNYACDARYGEILSDVTDMFFEIKSQLLYFNAEAYEKKKIKKAITKN